MALAMTLLAFLPHFLMFGWHPHLPVDSYLGTDPNIGDVVDPPSYVKRLKERMSYAYKLASKNSASRAKHNKAVYDRRIKENRLVEGDTVLYQKVELKGRNKLADKREQEPYTVLEVNEENAVYKIQLETGKGPVKTVHRNMILPYTSIPEDFSSSHIQTPIPKPKPKPWPRKPVTSSRPDPRSETEESEDDVGLYIIPPKRISTFPIQHIHASPVPENYESGRSSTRQDASLPVTMSQSSGTDETSTVSVQSPSVSHSGLPSPSYSRSVVETPSYSNSGLPSPSVSRSAVGTPCVSRSTVAIPGPRPVRLRRPPDRFGKWFV